MGGVIAITQRKLAGKNMFLFNKMQRIVQNSSAI